jgi:DNA ligase-1
VKSADPTKGSFKSESEGLIFWVYDVPTFEGDDTLPWSRRREILQETVSMTGGRVVRVDDHLVKNETEMMEHFVSILKFGYEGAILRGSDGTYLWGYRSAELLKVKKFQDAEFKVIGFRDGKGKDEGCAVFICRNDLTDDKFETRMKGTLAERQRFFREGDKYVDRKLTVRFFDRTDANIPRFPVGTVFRAPEDLPS